MRRKHKRTAGKRDRLRIAGGKSLWSPMTGMRMTQTALHEDEVTVMDLSAYRFEKLRKDGEFIVYRGYHRRQSDASPSSILGMTPVSERTALASLRRIEHDYLFRAERNHDRAARLLALAPHE